MKFFIPVLILFCYVFSLSGCGENKCYPEFAMLESAKDVYQVENNTVTIELLFYPWEAQEFQYHSEIAEQILISSASWKSPEGASSSAEPENRPPFIKPKSASAILKSELSSENPLRIVLNAQVSELENEKIKFDMGTLGYYALPANIHRFSFRAFFYPANDCYESSEDGYMSQTIVVSLR